MNSFFSRLKNRFVNGTAVMQLIYINIALFLICYTISVIFKLFMVHIPITSWMALPSYPFDLITHPWTILTYMFYHESFSHIFFNMIALYWFGRIALKENYNSRQIIALYIYGGLLGAAFYLIAYNLIPYFRFNHFGSHLLGASGAITAICVAVATSHPWKKIRLLFIGEVKIVWIAVAMILISYFGIMGHNAGGELTHLGGALMGYIFGYQLKKGRDLSMIFAKKKRIKKQKTQFHYHPNTAVKNEKTTQKETAEIDRILDKIKANGYGSLTEEEKEKLFNASNNK